MGTNRSPDLYYRALFNRASVYEAVQKLDLAQRDLEEMQTTFPSVPVIAAKLAEIGDQRKDVKLAIRNYELLLQNIDTNSPMASNAFARLKELRSSRR